MREPVDAARLRRVLDAFAQAATEPTRVYLVGGSTAVWEGWRTSTIDVDFVLIPESDAILRAVPQLKETLRVNLEMASPADFIPVPAGWEERSPVIGRDGPLTICHFELVAQALAKIERGHARDREDVAQMLERGLVSRDQLRRVFAQIEPMLHRFPAIDAPTFRRAVEEVANAR